MAESYWMMFPFITSLVCSSTGIPWGYLQNICMWTSWWFYQTFSQCKPLLLCGSFSNQIAGLHNTHFAFFVLCVCQIFTNICNVSSSLKIAWNQIVQKGFSYVLYHWFSLLCIFVDPNTILSYIRTCTNDTYLFFCIRQLKNAWRKAFLSAGMVWTTERLARK